MKNMRVIGRTERIQSLICGIIGIMLIFGGIAVGIFGLGYEFDALITVLFIFGGTIATAVGFGMYVYYCEPEVLKRLDRIARLEGGK